MQADRSVDDCALPDVDGNTPPIPKESKAFTAIGSQDHGMQRQRREIDAAVVRHSVSGKNSRVEPCIPEQAGAGRRHIGMLGESRAPRHGPQRPPPRQ